MKLPERCSTKCPERNILDLKPASEQRTDFGGVSPPTNTLKPCHKCTPPHTEPCKLSLLLQSRLANGSTGSWHQTHTRQSRRVKHSRTAAPAPACAQGVSALPGIRVERAVRGRSRICEACRALGDRNPPPCRVERKQDPAPHAQRQSTAMGRADAFRWRSARRSAPRCGE